MDVADWLLIAFTLLAGAVVAALLIELSEASGQTSEAWATAAFAIPVGLGALASCAYAIVSGQAKAPPAA
jgi:hypothetical protein